ncbi:ketoacyl-ACP synthase III [Streptomyces polychromogenes]|uniref:Beta-ketoacyl-[acyl-carrier-protein] synthase III n=2 Tax=Streptomyces TaxID=1883 RepID=A0ABP3FEM8_9ACTN
MILTAVQRGIPPMTGSRVVALGHYQPAKVLTNEDLAAMVETSDEWILSRVGIRTRHIAGPEEPVDELAYQAAAKALANGGLTPDDVDLVLVATSTAIDRSPNMAARVAAKLGMNSAPAVMDLNVVCSGFTHALATADHAIRSGSATRALVIGADKMAGITDWTDRTTCVLTGDGAGAAVVEASPEAGIGPVLWGSVPEMGHAVRIEGTPPVFAQEGQSVYRWTTSRLPALARKTCEKAGVTPEELAGVVLHQANLRIIEPLAAKIGAVNAVVARDVVDSGNTSAASIPMALSKLVERGEIPSGAPVLLFGFGGNLSYAGQVIRCP